MTQQCQDDIFHLSSFPALGYILAVMFWPFGKRKKERSELFTSAEKKRKPPVTEPLKAGRLVSLSLDKLVRIMNVTGPRPAGSDASREASRMLLEMFRPYSDDAVITSFQSSEKAYFGVFRLISLTVVPILLFMWIGVPVLSTLIFVFVCLVVWREFFLCLPSRKYPAPLVDMCNVHAVIESEEAADTTFIFTAHHDSAPIFNVEKGDRKSLLLSLYLPLVHYIVLGIFSLVMIIADIIGGGFLKISLPSLFPAIMLVLFTASSFIYVSLFRLVGDKYAPGAGDNLISSCMLTELAHYFYWKKENGEGLKNTRLVFASFDGEECGLKGSEEWFRRYSDLTRNAVVFNIDCPYYAEHLTFLTKDVNGFVPLSISFASRCAADAASMGYKSKVGELPIFAGATDAASAARAGLEATTIMGIPMSGSSIAPYHTADDVPDALDKATLEEVMAIAIKVVEKNYASEEPVDEIVPALSDESRHFSLIRK